MKGKRFTGNSLLEKETRGAVWEWEAAKCAHALKIQQQHKSKGDGGWHQAQVRVYLYLSGRVVANLADVGATLADDIPVVLLEDGNLNPVALLHLRKSKEERSSYSAFAGKL